GQFLVPCQFECYSPQSTAIAAIGARKSKRLRQPRLREDGVRRVATDDPDGYREAAISDRTVPDFVTALAGTGEVATRASQQAPQFPKVAGIHAAATTGTDCTRSATTCNSSSSPGAASPFSAAISGAIALTRETSCSNVGASVASGSSGFAHHHTPA